jgi:hypothetical protein
MVVHGDVQEMPGVDQLAQRRPEPRVHRRAARACSWRRARRRSLLRRRISSERTLPGGSATRPRPSISHASGSTLRGRSVGV